VDTPAAHTGPHDTTHDGAQTSWPNNVPPSDFLISLQSRATEGVLKSPAHVTHHRGSQAVRGPLSTPHFVRVARSHRRPNPKFDIHFLTTPQTLSYMN
jgi:hypothetical protein